MLRGRGAGRPQCPCAMAPCQPPPACLAARASGRESSLSPSPRGTQVQEWWARHCRRVTAAAHPSLALHRAQDLRVAGGGASAGGGGRRGGLCPRRLCRAGPAALEAGEGPEVSGGGPEPGGGAPSSPAAARSPPTALPPAGGQRRMDSPQRGRCTACGEHLSLHPPPGRCGGQRGPALHGPPTAGCLGLPPRQGRQPLPALLLPPLPPGLCHTAPGQPPLPAPQPTRPLPARLLQPLLLPDNLWP